jgi:hypothetical protein
MLDWLTILWPEQKRNTMQCLKILLRFSGIRTRLWRIWRKEYTEYILHVNTQDWGGIEPMNAKSMFYHWTSPQPIPMILKTVRHQWLTPVILATQEAEIRRIKVWNQPRQVVGETLSQKIPSQTWSGSRVGPEFKLQYPKKKTKLWTVYSKTLTMTLPER